MKSDDVDTATTHPVATWKIVGPGLGFIALAVMVLLGTLSTSSYDTGAAVVLGPVLILASLPILARQAAREDDPTLLRLLVLALLVKFLGALLRNYVTFQVYGGIADASVYHNAGIALSESFRAGDFHTGLDSMVGTDFVKLTTGLLYTVTGPTLLGGYLIYAWLGFWGQFFFYRAFTVAVPEGRSRTYAHLLFFLPSLIYWPAGIGKDSWMVFSLGIAAFGASRILSGALRRGLLPLGFGLWAAAMVRPPVAGMVAVGLALAAIVRPVPRHLRQLGPIVKAFSLVVVLALAVFLVGQTNRFLQGSGGGLSAGLTTTLDRVTARSDAGGSEFTPATLTSPANAPLAFATVLYRPLLFDAHNQQALAAALEGTFLLLLSLVRFKWILRALRSMRRQPYVVLCLVYIGIFVLGFSAVANFGILTRERVQLLPFFLVLLAIPPPRSRFFHRVDEAEERTVEPTTFAAQAVVEKSRP